MRISSNGKVGIGTTTPLSQLHVEGDLLVRGGTDGDIVTSHASATGPVLWARTTQAAWGLSTSSDGKGHVLGNWAAPQPILTFTSNRVGVVTTDPEATLHVDGDLLVRGAGWNGEMVTSSSASTGPVIWARNYQGAWGLSVGPDGKGHVLDDWNNPHPVETFINGKVGVGTENPESTLHVQGDLLVRGGDDDGDIVTSSDAATGAVLWARNYQAAWGLSIDPSGKGHILGDWNNPRPIMTFAYDKVGIGDVTMGPSGFYKLYVEGGIVSRDLKVTAQNFPDYVFAPDYSLMPLDELERFLNTEHHLPGFATATDVESAGGFEVGDMTTRLLKLAEEQSLYILQLNKEMEELRAHMAAFEKLR